jgi:K+-sensing histidine kinase KdpD
MGKITDAVSGALLGLSVPEEYDRAVQTPAERQIVIATDGSDSARHAVSAACKLAGALGARAVLLYVRPPIGALGEPYHQERLSKEMEHARAAGALIGSVSSGSSTAPTGR